MSIDAENLLVQKVSSDLSNLGEAQSMHVRCSVFLFCSPSVRLN